MEKITITGPNPLLIGDMTGGGEVPAIDIQAELYLPQGRGESCPAVVVSEGLGGLQERRERHYGRMLSNEGYVVLVIDSFASRGVSPSSPPAVFFAQLMASKTCGPVMGCSCHGLACATSSR